MIKILWGLLKTGKDSFADSGELACPIDVLIDWLNWLNWFDLILADDRCFLKGGGSAETFFVSEDATVGSVIGTASFSAHSRILTRFLRDSYEILTRFLRDSYEILTRFLRDSYEILTRFLRDSYEILGVGNVLRWRAYQKILGILEDIPLFSGCLAILWVVDVLIWQKKKKKDWQSNILAMLEILGDP